MNLFCYKSGRPTLVAFYATEPALSTVEGVGILTLEFLRFSYGVPDGVPAISHENPRNDDAVRSIAGSTVE